MENKTIDLSAQANELINSFLELQINREGMFCNREKEKQKGLTRAIKTAIIDQRRVVDAYKKSANEVINSRTDYKSVRKLVEEAAALLETLQSKLLIESKVLLEILQNIYDTRPNPFNRTF